MAIMNDLYTIEMKSTIVNKFLNEISPLETQLIKRLTKIRKEAVENCNEEAYLKTISIEKEYRHSKMQTIDYIFNSKNIDEAIDIFDQFINDWKNYNNLGSTNNCTTHCCSNISPATSE